MTTFGTIAAGAPSSTVFVESAQADDLQTRVNAALIAIFAEEEPQAVAAITLAGGGDGHTFVVVIESAAATDVDGGFLALGEGPGVLVVCYLASESEALEIARESLATELAEVAIADEQLAGGAKGTRFMGMVVAGTPESPTPPPSLTSFGSFFALMPGDNAATIAVGAAMLFPQDGPTDGTIVRSSSSQFVLPAIGTYEVSWQVSVTEAGQLMLDLNGSIATTANTVAGRATGTSQIMNRCLITTTVVNEVLRLINPAGNAAALTITPSAGGTHAVSAWLVIKRVA